MFQRIRRRKQREHLEKNNGFYSQHLKISYGFSLYQAHGRAAKPQSTTGLFIVPLGAVVPSWITNYGWKSNGENEVLNYCILFLSPFCRQSQMEAAHLHATF
jgi:hypothetical protein